jgi:hypothetical protein
VGLLCVFLCVCFLVFCVVVVFVLVVVAYNGDVVFSFGSVFGHWVIKEKKEEI